VIPAPSTISALTRSSTSSLIDEVVTSADVSVMPCTLVVSAECAEIALVTAEEVANALVSAMPCTDVDAASWALTAVHASLTRVLVVL
jgi:alkylhydroperoxidase/carboxymuconolactone decarboxylase family protein YurZ